MSAVSTMDDRVESILTSFKYDKGMLVSILQDIQAEYRYLPREALERVVREHPRHRDVHYNLATLHMREGRPLLALAELELELADHPRHRPASELRRRLQALAG